MRLQMRGTVSQFYVKEILKQCLEIEIRHLKVSVLVFWHFSLSWLVFFTRVTQELNILPPLLVNFEKLNPFRKVSGRKVILCEVIFKLGFRSKGV